jgi:hypothetical protein
MGLEDRRHTKHVYLMINKHENISVGVYCEDVGVPGWQLSGWSNDIEYMAEGETEDLVKKEVIFGNFSFFCMPLYTTCMVPWRSASRV